MKQFFHSVRIEPPPKPPVFNHPSAHIEFYPHPSVLRVTTTPPPAFTTPYPSLPSPHNVTLSPYFYQQIPPPTRLSQLPPQQNQRFHYPMKEQPSKEFVSMNPNFPRLLESQVPLPPPPIFSSNSSNFPPHMSSNFGSSILSQLLPPILQEPYAPPPPVVPSPPPQPSQLHVNPTYLPAGPTPVPSEPTKEEVMKVASKKRLFGFPRFPMPMDPRAFAPGPSCLSGWCGDECCDSRRQFSPVSTTIQATAMPGKLHWKLLFNLNSENEF